MENFLAALDSTQLRVFLSLVGANFVLALVAEIKAGKFSLAEVGNFAKDQVLPYGAAYAVAAVLSRQVDGWLAIREAVWAAILATFGGKALGQLSALGIPGIPKLVDRG